MGRVFIASLGFHEDRVIRRLMSCSATRDDRLYLVTASRVTAVERAYESLVTFCRRLGLPDPELVEVPTPLFEGVGRVLRILAAAEGEVVVDLSGGMRYLSVYVLMALFLSGRPATVYVQLEGGEGGEVVVPRQLLELARRPPRGIEELVLGAVAEREGATMEEVSGALGKSTKTVANVVAKLAKLGLVARRGRRGGIYLTELGRLALELAGGRRANPSG